MLLALLQPVLQVDVVVPAAALIDVQLVRAVDRDRLLDVAEELLEVDDVPIVLVFAVEPVRSADGLEEIVVTELVVEVDVRAARSVESRQELAHYD